MKAHLQALPNNPEDKNFLARFFVDTEADPLGKIDPATGQPVKRFVATCNVTVTGDAVFVQGIVSVPDGGVFALRDAIREKFPNVCWWNGERWDNEGNKRWSRHPFR